MKVGILTYHFSDNYGALFQAYALRRWFLNQGCEADFINYHPDHIEAGGSIQFDHFFSKKNIKVIYLKLTKLKSQWFGNKKMQDNFVNFRRDFLGISGPEYKTLTELENAGLGYDLLVCGSDQIWNPSEHFGIDPVYFLDFATASKTTRRISYAPSFGRNEIDPKYKEGLAALIGKLDSVSVREQSGVAIIKDLINKEVPSVPDPTILLSDYSDVMAEYPLSPGKYVFCYGLRSRAVIGDVAEAVAGHFDAKLYSPYNAHRRWKEIGETVYPCPRQWLFLMHNAEFVVTNSFHGTALSILLNKPFVVVGLQEGKASFNARALNLLNLVGLSDRFLEKHDSSKLDSLLLNPINWDEVNARVAELRAVGSNYLSAELSFAH